MNVTLIYLGRSGGGGKLARAVLSAIGESNCKLIVSDENEEIWPNETSKIKGIPSGILENIFFLFQRRERDRLLKSIVNEVTDSKVIFLMLHPIDFAIRRRLKNKQIYTVIHDHKPHKGEIWPRKITIRRVLRNSDTKIFLSKFVFEKNSNRSKSDSVLLPLIMPKYSTHEKNARKYDVVFLGRHKKYKNFKFQIKLIKSISENHKTFASVPKKYARKLHSNSNLQISTDWLTTNDFDKILTGAKCLVLTHAAASQSGLFIESLTNGIPVVGPRVPGIENQFEEFQIPWIYEPDNLLDACLKTNIAMNQSTIPIFTKNRILDNAMAWKNYFLN